MRSSGWSTVDHSMDVIGGAHGTASANTGTAARTDGVAAPRHSRHVGELHGLAPGAEGRRRVVQRILLAGRRVPGGGLMAALTWLAELDRGDAATHGAKAANLGGLMRIGVPVPPGFAIGPEEYLFAMHE